MKYRYLFMGLLCAGILATGVMLYHTYRNFRALETVNRELRRMISNSQPEKIMTRLREAEFRSEGLELDKGLLVRTENGDTIRLSEAVGEGAVVFRYSKYQCGACTSQQMLLLREKLKIDPKELIILSDYISEKDMSVFKGLYKLPNRIFAEISEWSIPADSLDMPYYIWLDGGSMRVKDLFIPLKENPSLSGYYIEALNRQYRK